MAAYLVGHITVKNPDLWQVYMAGLQIIYKVDLNKYHDSIAL